MRNLKRALSLVLAAMMLIGMMVVSAGAASKDFTDKDEIKHVEAVNTMVTLNVIAGKNDGSYFDPTGTLTRAEMAKLVTYILNGGVEPVLGEKVKPTYSDIDGHWAEKYIEYCTSMNIIVGDGTGKFNPEGTLTAEQCAKMLLTAMNYKDDIFGFIGNNWAINVNREANAAGLYEELGGLVASDPISRDDAAQMVYNAIQANTMRLSWQQDVSTGEVTQTYNPDGPSLFNSKFNGNIYEGVLIGSGKYAITVAGKTGAGAANRLSIALQRTNDGAQSTVAAATLKNFECDVDYTDLMGQYVKVIAGKNDTIYGVYSVKDENKILLNTTTNNVSMDGTQVKVDSTKYDLASTTAVIVNGGASVGTIAATYATAPKAADSIKLISYDGDSSIDLAVVETIGVSQVNYVGADSFTLTTPFGGTRNTLGTGSGSYKSASQKLADVTVYDGIAKDDYVIVTKDLYADKDVVEKATVTSMTVTGTKGTVGTDAQFMMDDGKWYKYANSLLTTSISTAEGGLRTGDTVDVIAIGNIMFFVAKTSANQGVKNVAYVINADRSGGANSVNQAYLLFSNGEKKLVDTAYNYNSGTYKNQLVTYRSTSDGYVLTPLAGQSAATLGFETVSANNTQTITAAPGSTLVGALGGKEVADDAIIILYPATSTTVSKVITGSELKRIDVSKFTAASATFATTKVNGFEKVAIASIKVNETASAIGTGLSSSLGYSSHATDGGWDLGITSGSNYGYLVSDAYGTTVDGVDYTNFKMVFNGQTVDLKEKVTYAAGTFKAGSIVAFDVVSDTEVKNVVSAGATIGAVSALSAKGDEVQFVPNDGTNTVSQTYKLNSDTTYIYIDSANKAAATGGSLNLAGKTGNVYVPNVAYLDDGSGNILLVVVDVNNQYAVNTLITTATAAAFNDALNGNNATSAGATVPGGVIIPESRTLTLTGTSITSWGSVLVRGTLKVDNDTTVAATGVSGNITGVAGAKVVVGDAVTMDANNFYASAPTAGTAPVAGAPVAGTTYVWTVWNHTTTSGSTTTVTPYSGWVAVQ